MTTRVPTGCDPPNPADETSGERSEKRGPEDFACAGGSPTFSSAIPVGQLYFPEFDKYEAAIRGIAQRHYYTNHGPLVRDLELRLEAYLGVRNALVVANGTLGLYLVALALGLQGKIIMPSFTFIATAQAFLLAGIEPVFCDVDPLTHHITPQTAEAVLEDGVGAVCAVNLWGGTADVRGLEDWAGSRELPLIFDSAHAFGVQRAEGMVGGFGRAEVFSFHATKVMSATEGGCVCTDDDDLAERVRNIRSDNGIRRPVAVPLTVNARMSEAEAAIALMSLDDFDRRVANNRDIFEAYRSVLATVPGVRVVEPNGVVRSNYQSVVVQISETEYGLSRDDLWTVLRAEGVRGRRYFTPGTHRCVPFSSMRPQHIEALPVTDGLCKTVLQLPVGAMVTPADAATIAGLIRDAHLHAEALRAHV
jgi:dTDP-4-amino-4,6-dideoxygalactose transaminase